MQADALTDSLRSKGLNANVYVGMRYWHPYTEEALEQIKRDNVGQLVILPLYPQFSISTSGSSLRLLVGSRAAVLACAHTHTLHTPAHAHAHSHASTHRDSAADRNCAPWQSPFEFCSQDSFPNTCVCLSSNSST